MGKLSAEWRAGVEKLLYAELNIVCMAVCVFMLHNLTRRYGRNHTPEQWIFVLLVAADVIILLTDMGSWLLAGVDTPLAKAVNMACLMVYYLFNPVICLLWLMYADYQLYQSWEMLQKRIIFYSIPAVISGVMSLLSPVTGWFFVLDAENQYERGSLFGVIVLAALVYLILPAVITLGNLAKYGAVHSRTVYVHLLVFPVFLGSAVLLQAMFFGVSVIWAAATLTILSAFISMQNADIVLDHLTGIYNRRRLDAVIPLKMKSCRPGNVLFLIMADINDFKEINDQFGHLTGDEALKQAVKILQESGIKSEDFVARYGGDEFTVLGERRSREEVEKLMVQIEAAAGEFCRARGLMYTLSFSMGLAICRPDYSPGDFLAEADREMYRKKELRNQRILK